MKTVIFQNDKGWTLQIGKKQIHCKRLMDAIIVSQLLKVHVDNRAKLPA